MLTLVMTLSGTISISWKVFIECFRPFGCSLIFSSWLEGKPELWTLDPSGAAFGYRGAAAGKAKNNARTEIEKLDFDKLTVQEGLKHAARIIHSVHDDVKGMFQSCHFTVSKYRIVHFDFRPWLRVGAFLGDKGSAQAPACPCRYCKGRWRRRQSRIGRLWLGRRHVNLHLVQHLQHNTHVPLFFSRLSRNLPFTSNIIFVLSNIRNSFPKMNFRIFRSKSA